MAADGRTKEALDELVRCYREVQAIRPGSSECQRLSSEFTQLGRSHPPALNNIEVLTGAGQADDARLLTEKLLARDNTEATRARLQEKVARARRPK